MKKSILILGVLILTISNSAFAQKKKTHNHNYDHHISNHHSFFGGILTGLLFSEVFGSMTHSHRKMYFAYKPYKNTWRLTKDYQKGSSIFYGKQKVIAKFENPNGGRDYVVHLNGREWGFDCPRRFAKIFKHKVKNNL